MKLIWTPSISVGNQAIDKQHQDLFEKANTILEAMAQGRGKEEISATIAFVDTYVMKHFQDEEKILASIGYPDLNEHIKHHNAFKIEFKALKDKLQAEGPNASIAIALNRILSDWLRQHISETDQIYAKFIKAA